MGGWVNEITIRLQEAAKEVIIISLSCGRARRTVTLMPRNNHNKLKQPVAEKWLVPRCYNSAITCFHADLNFHKKEHLMISTPSVPALCQSKEGPFLIPPGRSVFPIHPQMTRVANKIHGKAFRILRIFLYITSSCIVICCSPRKCTSEVRRACSVSFSYL